jgi:hypothetical protein
MDVRVEEGRLIEVPTPGATRIDRRAFGEFIGPGGEMASYALGWVTGTSPPAARITIGIERRQLWWGDVFTPPRSPATAATRSS